MGECYIKKGTVLQKRKKQVLRGREMTGMVKCLLCEHENLSLQIHHPWKK